MILDSMPLGLTIFLALGGSAMIGYVVTQVCVAIHHKGEKYRKMVKKCKQDEMREVMEDVNRPTNEKIDKMDSKLDANTKGTVTLLRDRMKASLDDCRNKGFASATDKANWHELYDSYKDLGGNHFIEYVNQWRDEMDGFPLEIKSRSRKRKKIKKVN